METEKSEVDILERGVGKQSWLINSHHICLSVGSSVSIKTNACMSDRMREAKLNIPNILPKRAFELVMTIKYETQIKICKSQSHVTIM